MENQEEFDFGPPVAAAEPLKALQTFIQEAIDLEALAEQQENELKATKAALQRLKTGQIPDLMAEIQADKINFRGWEVQVSDFVSGSLPKDDCAREKAIGLINEYGAGGIIKTEVVVQFGRSQHNHAVSFYQSLVEAGHSAEMKRGVHSQTLQKFARERIEAGEQIDLESLGLFTGKFARWKEAKK